MLRLACMNTISDMLQPDRVPKQAGVSCRLGRILNGLTEEDMKAVERALNDTDTYPGTYIAQVLRGQGHQISEHSVRRHRRGACQCGFTA